jgi:hypothetical protein
MGNFHLSVCLYVTVLVTFIPLPFNYYNLFFFFGPISEKSEAAGMRHFKTPITITYIILESWKMIIILIVRKGVLIWTK